MSGFKSAKQVVHKHGRRKYTVYNNDVEDKYEDKDEELAQPLPDF
jgi:hypothetical protein